MTKNFSINPATNIQKEADMAMDNTNTPETATSVTNRDDHITLQALLYAVACIQSLPEDRQERSIMVDMCAQARHMAGDEIARPLWSVEHHVGYEIDLWPAHGGDEPGNLYTEDEYDMRDNVRRWIDKRKARFAETGALEDAPPSEVVKFIGGADDLEGEAA